MANLDFLVKLKTLGRVFGLEGEEEGVLPEDLMYKRLRNLKLRRELQGPSELEKYVFEREKHAFDVAKTVAARRDEQNKTVLTTFTELYKSASPASKAVIEEAMGKYWWNLSEGEKTAAKMVMEHSPLNPMVQKGRFFDESVVRPKVETDPNVDIYAYAQEVFDLEDWKARREHYMTGNAPERRKLIGLANKVWGYRDDAGKVSVIESDDLALEQLAKKYDTTVGEILLGGGVIRGKEQRMVAGGKEFVVRMRQNVLEPGSRPEPEVIESAAEVAGERARRASETAYDREQREAITKLWTDITAKNQSNPHYAAILQMENAGKSEREIEGFLAGQFPGWNFRYSRDVGGFERVLNWMTLGGYGWLVKVGGGDRGDVSLTAIPGVPREFKTKDGKMFPLYWDRRTDEVYDGDGIRRFASFEEAQAVISMKTYGELGAEE